MSSPIAKQTKSRVDEALIAAHQTYSHSTRIAILANLLADRIQRRSVGKKDFQCLDIGCGDMKLSALCETKFGVGKWTGTDIHPIPPNSANVDATFLTERYRPFNGQRMPFEDKQFECGVLFDVLHHVPDGQREMLLREALRVCRYLIVKDHIEYSLWSRQVLRAMDFLGTYGYGVSVPQRYFNPTSFAELCTLAQCRVSELQIGVRLYDHLPVLRTLLRPQWHFICYIDAT